MTITITGNKKLIAAAINNSCPRSSYEPLPTLRNRFRYLVPIWPATNARFMSEAMRANHVALCEPGA